MIKHTSLKELPEVPVHQGELKLEELFKERQSMIPPWVEVTKQLLIVNEKNHEEPSPP
jgi:hypothetical protein